MRRTLIIALIAALSPGVAAAKTTVRFAPVETVSSFEFRDVRERDMICRELARYLTSLADRSLPATTSLTVDLVSVKPAGMLTPSTTSDVRVVSDVTPPRIVVRYTFTEKGRTVAKAEETLSDLNFLWDVSAHSSLASYPYEKALLRDWLEKRIVQRKPAP